MQFFVFFFNDTATTEIYTLSLHDALPICDSASRRLPPKEKGFLHMLGIPAPGPDSRCLLSAVIQQQAHLLGPKTRSAAGGRASPESRNGAVRAPVRHRLVARSAHAHCHARPDVITKRHGA